MSNGLGQVQVTGASFSNLDDKITYVAFRSVSVPLPEFGIEAPVAVWYPMSSSTQSTNGKGTDSVGMEHFKLAHYDHKISLAKIGRLLVGWNLPSFFSKKYRLVPTLNKKEGAIVVNGDEIQIPTKDVPMVLLAHGYLGSRFDLSHLAESLALEGFLCISAEYPESLSASYDSILSEEFNRSYITDRVLDYFQNEMNICPKSKGIVGHSLGCGTVVQTGDSSWTRVCIAGGFRGDTKRIGENSPVLIMSSMNDGAVTYARVKDTIPKDFASLNENFIAFGDDTNAAIMQDIPRRASFLFEGSEAPNHISFLSENVNDSMIDFLSPILPIALALGIPVLDFDRYKVSQDSDRTAQTMLPVIKKFLKQNMM